MILKEVNVSVNDTVEILDKDIEFREGNMNIYKLIFSMPEELNDLLSVAVFMTETGEVYKTAIIDRICYVPFDALKRGMVKLGVYSYRENELIHSPAPTDFFVGEGSYKEGSLTEDEFVLSDYERYLELNQQILDEIKILTDGLNEKVSEVEEKLENGDFDGYTPQRGIDYWTEQDKNEVINDVMTDVQPQIDSIKEIANTAETIAKGRATGYVFDTVEDLDLWLQDEENVSKLVLGDNLYIRAIGVPDCWWDGNEKQQLETQKVDLTDYVKNTDYATSSKAGVVKSNAIYGINVNSVGLITVVPANNLEIDDKTQPYKVITPATLDYAVKSVVGGHVTLTQAEYDALVKAGTVDENTYYYIKEE